MTLSGAFLPFVMRLFGRLSALCDAGKKYIIVIQRYLRKNIKNALTNIYILSILNFIIKSKEKRDA